MNKIIILLAFLAIPLSLSAQDLERTLLRGTVLYRNSAVIGENVINVNTEKATITNDSGEFEIMVAVGDVLAFTALNYQLKTTIITQEILNNNRLVVEVNEKVTELDEVVVSPENRKRFIELKEEEFKETNYETDQSTEVTNNALSYQDLGMQYGLNFVNIFKALFKSNANTDNDPTNDLLPSDVLRQVYDDEFFVRDLNIEQDKIGEFLFYLDDKFPSNSLLKKDNEFQLIDYLVNESRNFNRLVEEGQK